jgi:hypothetical protein
MEARMSGGAVAALPLYMWGRCPEWYCCPGRYCCTIQLLTKPDAGAGRRLLLV